MRFFKLPMYVIGYMLLSTGSSWASEAAVSSPSAAPLPFPLDPRTAHYPTVFHVQDKIDYMFVENNLKEFEETNSNALHELRKRGFFDEEKSPDEATIGEWKSILCRIFSSSARLVTHYRMHRKDFIQDFNKYCSLVDDKSFKPAYLEKEALLDILDDVYAIINYAVKHQL